MKINWLDLFSGIGGFAQGLKKSGFIIDKHYTSEIDKHAKAIYRHRFPESQQLGDVRHIRGSELERIDAITFGSPCQDFSLAGKRKGMDGERSSLITEAIRLIDECRPKFFIWENVKGTFSSNSGADFWAIIKAFADIGGYRLEWQLLNTAWFLPQNRERIYLVGIIGNGSGREVFPIKENDKRIDEKRKHFQSEIRADKDRANCITSSLHKIVQKEETKGNSQGYNVYEITGISQTLSSSTGGHGRTTGLYEVGTRIRRLTPVECERLQGFSDGWTEKGNYDGEVKQVSDTQRYKCLGNAVTVDVVQAVGERILQAL